MSPAGTEAIPQPRHGHVLGISKRSFHRIAYTEWGPPDAARVVVCVHGLSRQGRDFDALAMRLAKDGCRVVCPDLVGRGRSDWLKDKDEYGLVQYCADIAVLLARLDSPGIEWVGTSLGGLIGIVLASLPNSPVRKMVINDIGPLVPWSALYRIGSYLRQMPTEFPDIPAAERYVRDVHAPFGKLTDDEWRHLTVHSLERTTKDTYRMLCDPGIATAFRPSLLYNLTLWRYWDAISCPTLLLRGENSDLLLHDTAEQMSKRGPQASLVEIFDCGHAPALMDRDQTNLVARWLAG